MNNQKLYKGSLQTIILNLLDEKGKLYGYEITKLVKEITKGSLNITEGALYPTLHKLESEGVLEVEIAMFNNRKRKYYFLTQKGKEEKVTRLQELESFLKTMQSLINSKSLT